MSGRRNGVELAHPSACKTLRNPLDREIGSRDLICFNGSETPNVLVRNTNDLQSPETFRQTLLVVFA
ncbi:MAG: hypothetical protein U0795_23250 [Pirellulales bacterium]